MQPPRREWRRSIFAVCGRWLCGLVGWVALCASTAFAQPESTPPRPPTPPISEAPPTGETSRPEPRAETPGEGDIPAYHVRSLTLTGQVDPEGKLARLRAEIEVHINHPAAYYDVPLRLTQAAITHWDYEGPQEPTPVTPTIPDDGVHWLFRGLGRHRLTLDLVVELRTVSAGTNLQLTLPSGSRFFPTQLQLTIPQRDVAVDAAKDHTLVLEAGENGATVLNATIGGNRVDVTWRSRQERQGQVTRAITSLAVDAVEERLRLQATQDLVTDGQVGEVRVRMPPGFQLLSVSGRDYGSHAVDEATPGWVQVRLASRDRNEVQLDWLLEDQTPLQAGPRTIEGFEVQGAFSQSGTLGIAPLPGYKLYRLSTESDSGIFREEPRRMRPARGVAQFKWAWRYDRQPFELVLDLQEERPAFDVRTRAVLTTETSRMSLDVEYLVQVHAGRVQELLLHWPAPGSDEWLLQSTSDDVLVSDATDERSQFLGESQRITFRTPRDGEFSVRMQYQRPITPGRFELGLPRVESERPLPGWLIVRGVDAVEPQLDENSELAALSETSAESWLRGLGFAADRDQAYRVNDLQTTISGTATVYSREIRAESVVSVVRMDADGLDIDQRLQLDVRYGHVDELTLVWPAAFLPAWRNPDVAAIECRLGNGDSIPYESDESRLRLTLPAPLTGRSSIHIGYRLPLESQTEQVRIPVFTSPDVPHRSVRVESQSLGAIGLEPLEAHWQRIPTTLRPTWMGTGDRQEFAARLTHDIRSAPQRYVVDAAFARVVFDAAGGAYHVIDYRLQRAPAEISLELPAGVRGVVVQWNGVALPEAVSPASPTEAVQVALRLPPAESSSAGRLRIEYLRPPTTALDEFVENRVVLPVVPQTVLVNTTYLEIELPSDFCLLTYPPGLTPLFRWRPGLVFQREAAPEFIEWRRQFGAAPDVVVAERRGPPVGRIDAAGHAYAFWTTGGTNVIRFRTIRLWALILIGSGLTLAVAFLLWSAPQLRNVLTLLAIGFLVAVAGVFAPETVELLLQPVLLGLAAAVVAISLQSRRPVRMVSPSTDRSTRSERRAVQAPTAIEHAASAGMPPAPTGTRELQESGSRP